MKKKRTKGFWTNVVYFVGGWLKDVTEVGDVFVDCFKAMAGDENDAPKDAAPAEAADQKKDTSALADFFSDLNKVIEFLCYVKDQLLDYFKIETKRLMRLKKLNKKMNFVEKRKKMTRAQRKKLFGEVWDWVKAKGKAIKDAVVSTVKAVKDEVVAQVKKLWTWIKEKFAAFKAWVKRTWTSVQNWFKKLGGWIEKFNSAKACSEAVKGISNPADYFKEAFKKVKEWFTKISGRAVAIAAAIGGSPKDIAVVLVGIICAIPHVVKIVEYAKDTTITNEWYRWGKIVGRAGTAFTA